MMDKDHLLSWEEIRKILSFTINKLLCQGVRRLIMLMQEPRATVFPPRFGVMANITPFFRTVAENCKEA